MLRRDLGAGLDQRAEAEGGRGAADLFSFLTTEPNAEVGAVHPKAMPVILTTPEECDIWISVPTADALTLQGPLRDGASIVVAREEKQDPPANKTPEVDLACFDLGSSRLLIILSW